MAHNKVLCEAINFTTSGLSGKNRLLKAALSDRFASYSHNNPKLTGIPSKKLINIYDKFAHGGFGLIITGNASVDPNYLESAGNLLICRENETDERQQQFRILSKTVKQEGSLAILQLVHPGNLTPVLINPNPCTFSEESIKEQVIDRFVYAAQQARLYGFDGIQIHAAYANLLAQFMECLDNRLWVIEEIYKRIREGLPTPTKFIISIKLDSVLMGTQTQKSTNFVEMIKKFDKMGFDFIELAGNSYEKVENQISENIRLHLTQTKIFLTGGFRHVEPMCRAIQNRDADGIGIGRCSAAVPDLAKKLLTYQIHSLSSSECNHDWQTMIQMSITQLSQAGGTSWGECNGNACYGITDFSNKDEAANYRQKLQIYLRNVEKWEQENNQPFVGCFEYEPLIK